MSRRCAHFKLRHYQPVDVIGLRTAVPGTRMDVFSGGRFVPLRIALPNEEGYSRSRLLLARTRVGDLASLHCFDVASCDVLVASDEGEVDATALLAGFSALDRSAYGVVEWLDRNSVPAVRRREHPRLRYVQRLLSVFDDFVVRVARSDDTSVPGLEERMVLQGSVMRGPVANHALTVRLGESVATSLTDAVADGVGILSREIVRLSGATCLDEVREGLMSAMADGRKVSFGEMARRQRSGLTEPSE